MYARTRYLLENAQGRVVSTVTDDGLSSSKRGRAFDKAIQSLQIMQSSTSTLRLPVEWRRYVSRQESNLKYVILRIFDWSLRNENHRQLSKAESGGAVLPSDTRLIVGVVCLH
jgi:hypothetical protein